MSTFISRRYSLSSLSTTRQKISTLLNKLKNHGVGQDRLYSIPALKVTISIGQSSVNTFSLTLDLRLLPNHVLNHVRKLRWLRGGQEADSSSQVVNLCPGAFVLVDPASIRTSRLLLSRRLLFQGDQKMAPLANCSNCLNYSLIVTMVDHEGPRRSHVSLRRSHHGESLSDFLLHLCCVSHEWLLIN